MCVNNCCLVICDQYTLFRFYYLNYVVLLFIIFIEMYVCK